MTLLSVAQWAFDEVQIGREGTIVGSTRPGAQRMLRFANSVGRQLSRERDWQTLRRENTFTAVSGETQAGILPSDFERFVPETMYDRTNYLLLNGPIGPQQWQALKSYPNTGSVFRSFIYRNGDVLAYPAFNGGENIAFEYITSNWCEASDGTGQTEFMADTDVPRLDEELMTLAIAALWLQSEGLPSDHISARYAKRLRMLTNQDRAKPRVLPADDMFASRRHWAGSPPGHGGYPIIRSGF